MVSRIAIYLLAALSFSLCMSASVKAQIVVDDVKSFTEKECRWLHSQFLGECLGAARCTAKREEMDFSMSTQRGMYALETVLTIRAAEEIGTICEQTCKTRKRMGYTNWRASICKQLMK